MADTAQVQSIGEIMQELGHTHLDKFKWDIEGNEYEVIEHLEKEGRGAKIDPLLIEFHHQFSSIGLQKAQDALARIRATGFQRAGIADSGTE